MKNKRTNIFLVLIVLATVLFMSSMLVFSQEKVSLKYLWETGVVRGDIALGDYSMPVICDELLYIEQHGRFMKDDVAYGELEIYDMKTGELLKKIAYPGVLNCIGPVSNGKEVVYFNLVNNSLTKYEDITPVWEKKFDEAIGNVIMDKNNIYILKNKKLIKMDFYGNFVDSISNKKLGVSILDDAQYIYTYYSKDTLIKVDKESFKIIYQKSFTDDNSLRLINQNDKYLFSSTDRIYSKKTGDLLEKTFPAHSIVTNEFCVYFDEESVKIVCEDINNSNNIWEKPINYFASIPPVIHNNNLYLFTDRLEIIDLKTGETIWKDKKRNGDIDYVPQINITNKYVTVYISGAVDSVIRVYEKQNQ